MNLPVQTCFNLLSLRRSTMLIAVVELFMSAIVVFLLLLVSADTQEMAAILDADIEDNAHREGITLSEDSSLVEISKINGQSQNNIRLHQAQHLTVLVIIALYTGVVLSTIYLISCVLLLYGTVMRFRQLMLPWIGYVIMALVLSCTSILVFMFIFQGYKALIILIAGSLFVVSVFYTWLVVYSHYKELGEIEEATCSANHHTLKHGYFQFADKAYNV